MMKPMLGFNKPFSLDDVRYPVWGSPKIDGIRCLVCDGVALSRKLLPIPNLFVQDCIKQHALALEGFDGELIVGEPTAPDVFRKTMSGVMSIEGQPDFLYLIFDHHSMPGKPYHVRNEALLDARLTMPWMKKVRQTVLNTPEEVTAFEEVCVNSGWEGIILRDPNSLYKFGRSTFKEFALAKMKRFVDIDVRVLSIHEALKNDNDALKDELGNTKRSHSKEGRTEGKGLVGSMSVETLKEDGPVCQFDVGSFRGLSNEDKEEILRNKDKYEGSIAKIKVMQYGSKDAPRHGVFLSWRHPGD